MSWAAQPGWMGQLRRCVRAPLQRPRISWHTVRANVNAHRTVYALAFVLPLALLLYRDPRALGPLLLALVVAARGASKPLALGRLVVPGAVLQWASWTPAALTLAYVAWLDAMLLSVFTITAVGVVLHASAHAPLHISIDGAEGDDIEEGQRAHTTDAPPPSSALNDSAAALFDYRAQVASLRNKYAL